MSRKRSMTGVFTILVILFVVTATLSAPAEKPREEILVIEMKGDAGIPFEAEIVRHYGPDALLAGERTVTVSDTTPISYGAVWVTDISITATKTIDDSRVLEVEILKKAQDGPGKADLVRYEPPESVKSGTTADAFGKIKLDYSTQKAGQ